MTKLKLKIAIISFLVFLAGPAAATTLTSVNVTPVNSTLVLGIGGGFQFNAQPLDENSTPFAGATISWSSSNPTIAAILQSEGILTPMALGTTGITATAAAGTVTVTGTTNVTVVSRAAIAPSNPTLTVGSTQQFTASGSGYDQSDKVVTLAAPIAWSSNNASVATITTTGLLTALSPGAAVISANSNGLTVSTQVAVSGSAAPSGNSRKADTAIRQADSEKRRVAKTERTTKISSPPENISHADNFLSQAEAQFAKGNFAESERFARFAKNEFISLRNELNDALKRAKNRALGRDSIQVNNDNRLARNRITQADRQRISAINAAQRRGTTLPQNVLKRADDLLSDSRSELSRGNGQEAEQLARAAKNTFAILKRNVRTPDKIQGEFEIEQERERIEVEIKGRLEDDIEDRADEISRQRGRGGLNVIKTGETRVTVEIIGNNALVKVEVKFGTASTEQSIIAQEIVNRMKLTKDDVSRLLVIQNRVEDEELRERLEAKARVRSNGTEAEAKLRFPLSTTDRTSIIDGIFNRLSNLTAQNILNVMEFRVDVAPAQVQLPIPPIQSVLVTLAHADHGKIKLIFPSGTCFSPDDNTCNTASSIQTSGRQVTITATPDPGYKFDKFIRRAPNYSVSIPVNPLTYVPTDNHSITSMFVSQ